MAEAAGLLPAAAADAADAAAPPPPPPPPAEALPEAERQGVRLGALLLLGRAEALLLPLESREEAEGAALPEPSRAEEPLADAEAPAEALPAAGDSEGLLRAEAELWGGLLCELLLTELLL